MHIQIACSQIELNSQSTQILVVHNIDNIIRKENSQMQQHYQSAITATISHEQMNPLNSIINLSQMLFEKTKDQLEAAGSSDGDNGANCPISQSIDDI